MEYLCSCNFATTLLIFSGLIMCLAIWNHNTRSTTHKAQELLLPPFLRGKLGRVRRAPAPAPFLGLQVEFDDVMKDLSVSEIQGLLGQILRCSC